MLCRSSDRILSHPPFLTPSPQLLVPAIQSREDKSSCRGSSGVGPRPIHYSSYRRNCPPAAVWQSGEELIAQLRQSGELPPKKGTPLTASTGQSAPHHPAPPSPLLEFVVASGHNVLPQRKRRRRHGGGGELRQGVVELEQEEYEDDWGFDD